MREFAWQKFGGNYWNNPLAPRVDIEFVGPQGPVSAVGLLDTGADSTELPTAYLQTLGIGFASCGAMKAHGAWRPFTIVEARLDDHVFDLPVTFVDVPLPDGQPLILFGRLGILERFRVNMTPETTRFEWIEGSQAPIVAAYDDWLVQWLQDHPGGFAEGTNYDVVGAPGP